RWPVVAPGFQTRLLWEEFDWKRRIWPLVEGRTDSLFAEGQRNDSEEASRASPIARRQTKGVRAGSSSIRILICLRENCRGAFGFSGECEQEGGASPAPTEAGGRGKDGRQDNRLLRAVYFDAAGD